MALVVGCASIEPVDAEGTPPTTPTSFSSFELNGFPVPSDAATGAGRAVAEGSEVRTRDPDPFDPFTDDTGATEIGSDRTSLVGGWIGCETEVRLSAGTLWMDA